MDRVAAWTASNERVLAPTTASLALITLRQVCRYAVRRGWLAHDPVERLEGSEKPRREPQPTRILQPADLPRLLEHAGPYRPLFEFLAFTGLRIGEALGLRWCDVNLDAAVLQVRRQLSRHRTLKRLKTDAGTRDVILAPAVVQQLRVHWLASPYKAAGDLVWLNSVGRPMDYRKVGEWFRTAARRAGLEGHGRLTVHSLRHGYASMLIANGLNVVFVSRQLGHAKPTVTLGVYAHLFAEADHAAAARAALQTTYEAINGEQAG